MKSFSKIIGISIITAIVLSGCATTNELTESEKLAKNEMRCKKVLQTGSNIKSRRCRTKQQEEEEKESSQELVRRLQKTGPRVNKN